MKRILFAAATLSIFVGASRAAAQSAELPSSAPTPASTSAPTTAPPAVVIVHDRSDQHRGTFFGDAKYRSPGLAAALSLTPIPVDFGNFYAENVGWGLIYTTGQLALMGSMMWLGGTHMCNERMSCSEWSGGETAGMAALVSGYVVVKIVAAFHAASGAQQFNMAQPSISAGAAPVPGGVTAGVVTRF